MGKFLIDFSGSGNSKTCKEKIQLLDMEKGLVYGMAVFTPTAKRAAQEEKLNCLEDKTI